ncbi:MAG: alpha/beta hydrolase domain-containing protein [Pseudolysinimonas sp.]
MSRQITELSIGGDSVPFGVAFLPELQMGVDLAAAGYVEQEFLLRGTANVWRHGADGEQLAIAVEVPFCTRVLLRRPTEREGSGLVQVEPLHPDLDSALVWNAIHPWLLRNGHSWMGVTVFSHLATQLTTQIDPERYRDLDIPEDGQQYDILAAAVQALLAGDLGDLTADRVILAGMSATGSFCRVVLQDGFHRRWTRADGTPLIDGFVIGISSGGAGAAGYPLLSPTDTEIAADDPRRTIVGRNAIAFEVLSETEAETHERVTRLDSDSPDDRYRLYEIAGAAHIEAHPSVLTNLQQFDRAGGVRPAFAVLEQRSDSRFDLYLRGAFAAMDSSLIDGVEPPRAGRFSHRPGVEELQRDDDGNVLGGVRTPWIAVPTAAYAPHSTASAESEPPPEWMPFSRPEMLARLVGSMHPFALAELRRRYGTRASYLDQFAAATREQVATGLLLEEDAAELLRTAAERWRG